MEPMTMMALLAAAGATKGFFDRKGTKTPKLSKLQTLNSSQRSLLRKLGRIDEGDLDIGNRGTYKAGRDYLRDLLSNDPEAMKSFEAPFMRQFEEQTVPQLAERFSGLGAQNSSAFQTALSQSGAQLQEQLASLRGGLQMQALPQALQYAQAPGESAYKRASLSLGTSPYGYLQSPRKSGYLSSIMSGGLGGVSGGLPFMFNQGGGQKNQVYF